MSSRKGLSFEEKRTRMLELFYEKKDFFLLKELEKIAPKEKGIVTQSVKEVVQSLADDTLVDTDKIGTSVYYWSFPSKATATRKRKLESINEELTNKSKRLKTVEKSLTDSCLGKEDTEERTQTLQELSELEAKKAQLQESLKAYKDNDPETLKVYVKETQMAKTAINRWTDNIYSIQSWIRRKFPNINVNDFNKQFDIPCDIDYV
ncbi:Meiotic nuclear division protein 1 homolog [Lepeophtheirus salmonis]|uniref:Meiotic nuclear division protein 1 homolog n=2 Tax=Lepeophtheirus salmonis TaxID=72036 RepID=A0A7R8CJ42_LEPSM|nr:meiotic nuclear division protein 1 homolog [Lepeophtheirus salmonis]CAB4058725.1 Meiotic nuclear division protein 1 homolog [Lepeophtheirus salmonis]CAF2838256.1 Meiotic nuclear division protein 1 homolog [Lepeophtheirus salmonis]